MFSNELDLKIGFAFFINFLITKRQPPSQADRIVYYSALSCFLQMNNLLKE